MYSREKLRECEYDVTGLVDGTGYHFRVSAENAAGCSAASNELGPITARTPIKFTRALEDVEVKVEDSVKLLCEVNKDGTTATWYKDGNLLKPSDRFKVSQDGRRHVLTIKDITLEDESEYSCKVSYVISFLSVSIIGDFKITNLFVVLKLPYTYINSLLC